MSQNYALYYFFVSITLSDSFNIPTDYSTTTGKVTVTTNLFRPTIVSPLVEDANCRNKDTRSKRVQENKNKTKFDMLTEDVISTTEEVNKKVSVIVETNNGTIVTDLSLNKDNGTYSSKTPIKRQNIEVFVDPIEVVSNRDRCPKFKNGIDVPLSELTGDWRTVFYKASQVISCFKIHIKKISFEAKIYNKERYGTFNRSVDWHKCHLKISGSRIRGRHFLQGGLGDDGVLRNIIIVKDNEGSTKLQEEAPDQWRAFSDLLILRACDNGDVIVFARFGRSPDQDDIKDAMEVFGETKFDGLPTCQDTKSMPSKNDTEDEDPKGDIPKAESDDSRPRSYEDESKNTDQFYDQFFK